MKQDPTRTEQLLFRLDLEKDKVEKHREDIARVLAKDPGTMSPGDLLKVSYSIFVQYFGDVAQRLEALNRILNDPEVVLNVSTREVKNGFCLIESVFRQIERIQQRLEI